MFVREEIKSQTLNYHVPQLVPIEINKFVFVFLPLNGAKLYTVLNS